MRDQKTKAPQEQKAVDSHESQFQRYSQLLDTRTAHLLDLLVFMDTAPLQADTTPRKRKNALEREMLLLLERTGGDVPMLLRSLNQVFIFAARFIFQAERENQDDEQALRKLQEVVQFFENLYRQHAIQ